MTRKIKFVQTMMLIALFLVTTGFGPGTQAGQDNSDATVRVTQVDTSQFPEVTIYVTVVDADGQPVEVDPASLVIEEDGKPIPPDQIEGIGEVGRLTTLLVMDVSGSMYAEGKLAAAKSAAIDFIDQMRPGDLVGLLSFSDEIKYVLPITANREEIISAINGLVAEGDTAMYDALVEGVGILEAVEGRKAIIALTDGLDNRSLALPEDVLQRIGPSGLSISTIGLGNPEHGPGAVSALDEEGLTSLANNAGGVYGYADDEESLRHLYQTYAVALQSEYVLTYTSPAALRDGVNRALSVTLASSSGSFGPGGEQIVYNPGGLLPEVSEPAPWPMFFSLIAGLAVLLIIPGVFNWVGSVLGKNSKSSGGKRRNGKKRPSIKLK